MSISEDRHAKEAEALERVKTQVATAFLFNGKGLSVAKIAEEMQLPESAVRTLLAAPDEFRS